MIGNVFTMLFILEAIIKIIAMGFLFHKNSYMRDIWNIIDFVIVITGALELITYFFPFGAHINIKSLRNLRVLRPLRSINTVPSMKRLVETLISSLP